MEDKALALLAEIDRKAAELDRLRRELRGRLELERAYPELKGRGRILTHYLATAPDMSELRQAVTMRFRGIARKSMARVTVVITDDATKEIIVRRSLDACSAEAKVFALLKLTACSRESAESTVYGQK